MNPHDLIRSQWERAKRQANIRPELHPHDLRRTLATALHRATGDVLAVQQALGHEDLSTTSFYLAPHEPERMRALLGQLHWNWNAKRPN